jgi:hypothetical protein
LPVSCSDSRAGCESRNNAGDTPASTVMAGVIRLCYSYGGQGNPDYNNDLAITKPLVTRLTRVTCFSLLILAQQR